MRDKTDAGFPVLAGYKTAPSSTMLPGWIVLCDISSENTDEPFAVWWMNENGLCSAGDYYEDIREATEGFARRIKLEAFYW